MSQSIAQRLRQGETVYIAWSSIAAPHFAQLLAKTNFDGVLLDMQHGTYDITGILDGIGVIHGEKKPATVRVPVGQFNMISRALDFGATIVISPMINTLEEAKLLVKAAKYPPIGERSWGPVRNGPSYGAIGSHQYLTDCNNETLCFAMIETRQAYANLDPILALAGIDGIFVGPSDFSIGWSNGNEANADSKDIEEPLHIIAEKTEKAGKIPGIFCGSVEFARKYRSLGFRYLTLGTDVTYMNNGVEHILKQVK